MTGLSSLQRYLPKMAAARGLVDIAGVCEQHGEFVSLGVAGSAAVCLECVRERDRLAAAAGQREHMLHMSGVPRRYRQSRFRDLEVTCDEQRVVLAAVKGWVGRFGRGEQVEDVVIHGGPGTGKTHMASAAILNLITQCGVFARYATTGEMVDEIASAWGVTGKSESAEIARFGRYGLLVLDEVDIFDNPNPALRHLNMVINQRYNEGLPTVFITNQTPARLADILGRRAGSRIFERALVLGCPWADYRQGGSAGNAA